MCCGLLRSSNALSLKSTRLVSVARGRIQACASRRDTFIKQRIKNLSWVCINETEQMGIRRTDVCCTLYTQSDHLEKLHH